MQRKAEARKSRAAGLPAEPGRASRSKWCLPEPSAKGVLAGGIILTHTCRALPLKGRAYDSPNSLDPSKQLACTGSRAVYGLCISPRELFWEQACFDIGHNLCHLHETTALQLPKTAIHLPLAALACMLCEKSPIFPLPGAYVAGCTALGNFSSFSFVADSSSW